MINNLLKAAHELIFNRRISNMNSNTVQGAIDELKGTLGYTKKNHFKYITDGFTYNGIVAQKNSDGSMTVSGTATDNVDYQIGVDIYPENEQYILSGYTEGADADCNIYAAYWEDASTWKSAEAVLDDKGVLITKAKGNICKVCLYVAKGKTVNIKFYPMVRYASIKDNTYEPYVADVQTQIDKTIKRADVVNIAHHIPTTVSTSTVVVKTHTVTKRGLLCTSFAMIENSAGVVAMAINVNGLAYASMIRTSDSPSISVCTMVSAGDVITWTVKANGSGSNNTLINGCILNLE